jgi:hypothetical protein
MATPSTAMAGAPARREGHWWSRSSEGAHDGRPQSTRPAALKVVPRAQARRRRIRRGRLLDIAAVGLVLSALFAVVVGQAMLANGQVRLAGVEQELQLEQGAHRQQELDVSQRETPARIVAAASDTLHMIHPAQVIELPYVPLSAPLPTPKVAPAPPAASSPSPQSTSPQSTSPLSTSPQSTSPQSGSASPSSATSTTTP